MIKAAPTYYFQNRLGHVMLLAFEEVIGKRGLNALLNLSSLSVNIDNHPPDDEKNSISFETISRLQLALEQEFGPHGGRGIALRTGRVFFSNALRKFGLELGLNDTTFRLQPPDLKITSVITILTEFLNQHTD